MAQSLTTLLKVEGSSGRSLGSCCWMDSSIESPFLSCSSSACSPLKLITCLGKSTRKSAETIWEPWLWLTKSWGKHITGRPCTKMQQSLSWSAIVVSVSLIYGTYRRVGWANSHPPGCSPNEKWTYLSPSLWCSDSKSSFLSPSTTLLSGWWLSPSYISLKARSTVSFES